MIAQSVGVVGALLEPLQVARIALQDPSEAGKIVGQGGKTINAISSEWGVRIDMIDGASSTVQLGRRGKSRADRPDPTHVAIVGTPHGVEGAAAAVKALLGDHRDGQLVLPIPSSPLTASLLTAQELRIIGSMTRTRLTLTEGVDGRGRPKSSLKIMGGNGEAVQAAAARVAKMVGTIASPAVCEILAVPAKAAGLVIGKVRRRRPCGCAAPARLRRSRTTTAADASRSLAHRLLASRAPPHCASSFSFSFARLSLSLSLSLYLSRAAS